MFTAPNTSFTLVKSRTVFFMEKVSILIHVNVTSFNIIPGASVTFCQSVSVTDNDFDPSMEIDESSNLHPVILKFIFFTVSMTW